MPATLVQDPRIAEDVYLKSPPEGGKGPWRLWWVVRLKSSTEFGCRLDLRLEELKTGERVWRTDRQIRERFELVVPDRSTGATPEHTLLLEARIAAAQAKYKASVMRRGSIPT